MGLAYVVREDFDLFNDANINIFLMCKFGGKGKNGTLMKRMLCNTDETDLC